MSAAATDLAKKLSRRWVGQIGAGGVADDATTTVPLSSATNLPTDTAVVAVIDRVDSNGDTTASLEETVIGVVSGSSLVSCVRGSEGTAQAHAAGAVVEILVTAKGWNDLVDHLLTEHNQLGGHKNITASNINASGTISNQITNADLVLAGNGTGKVKENARYGVISSDTIASSQVILNMATSNNHAVALTSVSTTSIVVSNVTVNQVFTVRLLQDAGGSNLVSWFSSIKWTSATVPTLTTTGSRADWYGFICTSASNYDGFTIGSNLG